MSRAVFLGLMPAQSWTDPPCQSPPPTPTTRSCLPRPRRKRQSAIKPRQPRSSATCSLGPGLGRPRPQQDAASTYRPTRLSCPRPSDHWASSPLPRRMTTSAKSRRRPHDPNARERQATSSTSNPSWKSPRQRPSLVRSRCPLRTKTPSSPAQRAATALRRDLAPQNGTCPARHCATSHRPPAKSRHLNS